MLKRDFKQRVKLPFIDGCSSCWGRCVCVCGGRGGSKGFFRATMLSI